MLFYNKRNDIIEKIVSIYYTYNIISFPIDCCSLLNSYAFRLYTYEQLKQKNAKLYQMCIAYSNDSFRFGDMIAYNEKKNKNRIRFSLMHELGHVVLEHESDSQENEDEANYFASNILAPRILIHKMTYQTSDHIHDYFGLSYAASNKALTDYRMWLFNIGQTTRRPTPAEKQLELLFFPEPQKIPAASEEKETEFYEWSESSTLSDSQQWYFAKGL